MLCTNESYVLQHWSTQALAMLTKQHNGEHKLSKDWRGLFSQVCTNHFVTRTTFGQGGQHSKPNWTMVTNTVAEITFHLCWEHAMLQCDWKLAKMQNWSVLEAFSFLLWSLSLLLLVYWEVLVISVMCLEGCLTLEKKTTSHGCNHGAWPVKQAFSYQLCVTFCSFFSHTYKHTLVCLNSSSILYNEFFRSLSLSHSLSPSLTLSLTLSIYLSSSICSSLYPSINLTLPFILFFPLLSERI